VIEYNRGEMHTDLLAAARRWIAADPDPDTRQEMQSLLDARDHAALEDRLGSALTFGTAGLRGVLGAGTNRMNLAVVLRTTVGLCRYLRAVDPAGAQRGVVVGYDGRRMSREFAEAAARVIAAEGLPCHLFDDLGPTPLVAYAVRALEAAAGVMVTASHNPPEYNGYKVYWGNGAQIIPPQDVGIAAAIDAAPPASELQLPSLDEARASGRVTAVPAALTTEYRDAVLALDPDPAGAPLRIVYTAMHGVGAALATDVLARRGEVFSVPAQHAPDGRFPTVRFPNPEEPGAMDLALALARETHADLVIANDPDADRLAAAIPEGVGWTQLTGNEVGVLLGHELLTRAIAQGAAPETLLVALSIVSSPLLPRIAHALGAECAETLTGFKWIANRAMDVQRERGLRFVFGYEEALGYSVGELVRDKDGVSAAYALAGLAARLKSQGPHAPRPARRDRAHLRALRLGPARRDRARRRGARGHRRRDAVVPRGSPVESVRSLGARGHRLPIGPAHPRHGRDRAHRAAPVGRAQLRARRRLSRDAPPERHRAQDQVLLRPPGRGAGAALDGAQPRRRAARARRVHRRVSRGMPGARRGRRVSLGVVLL
jgi:phosphomannomutase